jgi:hypothetical protein
MEEFGLGEPIERPNTPDPVIPASERDSRAVESPTTKNATPDPTVVLDDFLLHLIRESRLSIDPVDLDMDRWLREHPPE